jgi:adenylate cyclase
MAGWILVVDDDATDRLLLFRLLEHAGHNATIADNGTAALELLRAEPFDLVLLDLAMPDPDGFAVLDALRQEAALPDIPVVVMSAPNDLDSVVRAVQLGAVDYVEKPVDEFLLQRRVAAALDCRGMKGKILPPGSVYWEPSS